MAGANKTLENLRHSQRSRRQVLRGLSVVMGGALLGWGSWQQRWLPGSWNADFHTGTTVLGEQLLADGSRIWLNSGTVLDVNFSVGLSELKLYRGEVLINTGGDRRPFVVDTPQGRLRPLGTRFSVRVGEQASRVAVTEGAVELLAAHAGQGVIVKAGEQGAFSVDRVAAVEPLDVSTLTWENGMLLAQHMRLADLLDELGRYRAGVLRCHPGVARLTVSGAFPLRDTDASLRLLQETLPVTVSRLTGYWVTVEPR